MIGEDLEAPKNAVGNVVQSLALLGLRPQPLHQQAAPRGAGAARSASGSD